MKKNIYLLLTLVSTVVTGCMKDEGPDMPTGDDAAVVINEAHSRGKDSQYPLDWVELYNTSDEAVDISGYILSDKADMSERITIPAGTTLAAHGFLQVVVDTEDGFGLSSDGDVVYLYNDKGENVDNIEFGPMDTDESWSANPDGSETFAMMTPTPGASNTGGSSGGSDPDYTQLFINEVKVSDFGTDEQDWIEFYNAGNEPIDMAGLKIVDSGDEPFTIPAGNTIAAGGFLIFAEDAEGSFDFGLGKSGETVELLDAENNRIDFIDLTPAGELGDNAFPAYARTTDGGSTWAKTATPTKNASNSTGGGSDYSDLLINEVKVSDFGSDQNDWIEFYNAGSRAIDMSGMKIQDSNLEPFTIPAGKTIAAGGFLTFTQDETGSFEFGLGKNGESVELLDSDNNRIDFIDLTPAGAFEDDEFPAYARTTDGGTTWAKTAAPTKNASNTGGGTPESEADYSKLFINEVKVSDAGSDDEDWIELYNAGDVPLTIAGFTISDSKASSAGFAAGKTIASKGFVVLTEGVEFSFGLSADGETITLRDAQSNQIDRIVTPGGLEDDVNPAYARTTDGGATWAEVANPTKGTTNVR